MTYFHHFVVLKEWQWPETLVIKTKDEDKTTQDLADRQILASLVLSLSPDIVLGAYVITITS